METHKLLLKDADGEDMDEHMYRTMIGSLMYLTSSRPNIIYLKGQPKLGLWYRKDLPFDLVAYTDSDYAGASLDRKSTTRDKNVANLLTKAFDLVAILTKSSESEGFKQIVDFLNACLIKYALTVNPTIYTSCIEQFLSTAYTKTVNGAVQLQALVDGKKIVVTEASVRRDLQLEDLKELISPTAINF
ncbi:hypothetical protein Tco_0652748 [Tanacetum coccineum]|uniref:Uncharacterized protein n=1 Tax=Tanacetum coccineum TaxID=301880 RepID=A0ABQ4WYI4_9ASTR